MLKLFIAHAASMFLTLSVIMNACGHDGTVNLTGSILDNTCIISIDSKNISVNLDSVASKNFTSPGETSMPVKFEINLENCGQGVSGVSVTFTGEHDENNPDLLKVTESKTSATGVGIAILDDTRNLLPLSSTSKDYVPPKGEDHFSIVYYAQYMSTSNAVTAGNANANAIYTLTYS